jgi:hypothetical protein
MGRESPVAQQLQMLLVAAVVDPVRGALLLAGTAHGRAPPANRIRYHICRIVFKSASFS